MSEPPCQNCPVYSSCTAIVRELETAYLNAVEKLIGEGGMLPRYACFYSKRDNNSALWAVPDRKFVVKTSIWEGIYNVSTCHNPAQKKMGEILLHQIHKIRKEADTGRGIVWCDEDTWNIRKSEKNQTNREPDGKKKKKGKKLLPYRRGGSNTFRNYLPEDSDDNNW
ncbi:MAG: hypothetical protein V2I97_11515 [Desulfococcaceae bacterium]|nr:hypothetical protein [Desulfococcaceae bacterium]